MSTFLNKKRVKRSILNSKCFALIWADERNTALAVARSRMPVVLRSLLSKGGTSQFVCPSKLLGSAKHSQKNTHMKQIATARTDMHNMHVCDNGGE